MLQLLASPQILWMYVVCRPLACAMHSHVLWLWSEALLSGSVVG